MLTSTLSKVIAPQAHHHEKVPAPTNLSRSSLGRPYKTLAPQTAGRNWTNTSTKQAKTEIFTKKFLNVLTFGNLGTKLDTLLPIVEIKRWCPDLSAPSLDVWSEGLLASSAGGRHHPNLALVTSTQSSLQPASPSPIQGWEMPLPLSLTRPVHSSDSTQHPQLETAEPPPSKEMGKGR